MKKGKKSSGDPIFAAEMAALEAERHERWLNRLPGDGRVTAIDDPELLASSDHPADVSQLRSEFRPTTSGDV